MGELALVFFFIDHIGMCVGEAIPDSTSKDFPLTRVILERDDAFIVQTRICCSIIVNI